MELKELAAEALRGPGDFGVAYWDTLNRIPHFNDMWYTYDTEKMTGRYFRYSDKVRFSLKIDGEEIPFATVERKGKVFPRYETRVEILPCMIPQALEALAYYT